MLALSISMTFLRTHLPSVQKKKKEAVKKQQRTEVKKRKQVTDDVFVPEDVEEEEEVVVEEPLGSHPSKNYTKIDLYDRWVRSRKEATDNKVELEEVQKKARKTQKDNNRLVKESGRLELLVADLQE